MPNYLDTSSFDNVKELEINPIGWINPITIKYTFKEHGVLSCLWWVKGTTHVFIIPTSRLNIISNGDYADHFKDFLEKFASEEYKEWKNSGFNTEWKYEYYKVYNNFIL